MPPAHTLLPSPRPRPSALFPAALLTCLALLLAAPVAPEPSPGDTPPQSGASQPQSGASPTANGSPDEEQPLSADPAPDAGSPHNSLTVQVIRDTLALRVIRRIDATERVQSSRGTMRQVITTSGGDERTLEMEAWSRDRNDKQLMVYTAPRRVAGDKILMLNQGDDIWFYTPRTDRVRHLASHARRQKVQGSDFAYEDMAGGSIEEDYTFALLGQEDQDDTPCHKLELVPTDSGPHYSRLILWADRERYLTRRIDYYEDGDLLKRLTTSDVRQIGGQWVAMRIVMENLREGGRTVMETQEIEFDVDLPDQLFTTGGLKRRSR